MRTCGNTLRGGRARISFNSQVASAGLAAISVVFYLAMAMAPSARVDLDSAGMESRPSRESCHKTLTDLDR